MRARLTAHLAGRGVAPARLDLRGGASPAELLAAYGEIDLALAPFPYSGGVTTCEALWMGVPVITLRGHLAAVRHSTSHLFHAGLGDWIADVPDDYVARAARWAADLPALTRLRAELRGRLAASPLCDAAGFTRGLEAAFLDMWAARRPVPGAAGWSRTTSPGLEVPGRI